METFSRARSATFYYRARYVYFHYVYHTKLIKTRAASYKML